MKNSFTYSIMIVLLFLLCACAQDNPKNGVRKASFVFSPGGGYSQYVKISNADGDRVKINGQSLKKKGRKLSGPLMMSFSEQPYQIEAKFNRSVFSQGYPVEGTFTQSYIDANGETITIEGLFMIE